MSQSKPTLGDTISDRREPCKIRGCEGHWVWSGKAQLEAFSKGVKDPPGRMCPECFELYKTLEDRELKCSRPECENTWIWKRGSQLRRMRVLGRDDSPQGLCESCRGEQSQMNDKEVSCRVRECGGTWTWTAGQQLKAGALDKEIAPPQRMCDRCFGVFKKLKDREMSCSIKGCDGTWLYRRDRQLSDVLRGKDAPRPRMCERCYERFTDLADLEVPCRVDGCEKTWHWPRMAQLQAWADGGFEEAPHPPKRMCPDCSSLYNDLKEEMVPCRIRECPGTWPYHRGSQLNQIKGKGGKGGKPPQKLCTDCLDILESLEDKEVPCKNDGCERTWTWSKMAQLYAMSGSLKKDASPPLRMCDICSRFLKEHPVKKLVCPQCGDETTWPSQNQLKVFLGLWREPEVCATCKRKQAH